GPRPSASLVTRQSSGGVMREVAGRRASDEDEERGLDRRALLTLADGTPVDIRPLDERDVGRLVNFFRHVPVEDRLFLREDVVVSDVVYNWVRNYGPQRSLVLVAEA